jgi:alkanesulfonate monooxygenase SsuD/methylene tetrahydromethanopterin reductase-like flavin-dependent oxidoreductase (luciferase family)
MNARGKPTVIVGTAPMIAERIRAYEAADVKLMPPALPPHDRRMERFVAEIMPRLR